MVWWLALFGLAWADCDNGALTDALAEARSRYASVDEAAFRAAMDHARVTLGCMREPLWRPTVAEWHRTTALLVAVNGGEGSRERVIAGLRAGLEIDPTLSIFPGALPENYWVARYDEARALDIGPELPVAGPVVVDGRDHGGRHAALPAVVQCLDAAGGVQWTREILAEETMPACEAKAPVAALPTAPPPDPCAGRLSHAATWGVLGGTAVAAAGSAGLYLWNANARAHYSAFTTEDSREEFTKTWREVNGTGAAFLGAGLLAVGLGTTLGLKACF